MPTVAAARKASLRQVVISCSPGKNNQAIIQISDVFMRKFRGGQRIFTVLGVLAASGARIDRSVDREFLPKLTIKNQLYQTEHQSSLIQYFKVSSKINLA